MKKITKMSSFDFSEAAGVKQERRDQWINEMVEAFRTDQELTEHLIACGDSMAIGRLVDDRLEIFEVTKYIKHTYKVIV